MKKFVLSIGAVALIALAAMNVSIALQSEKGAKWNLASSFSLADNENGSGDIENSPVVKERGDQSCGNCCKTINANGKVEYHQKCSCPGIFGAKDCSPIKCPACDKIK